VYYNYYFSKKMLCLFAVCILMPSVSFAQAKFNNSTDILGINLTMSKDDITKTLQANNKDLTPGEYKKEIQTPNFKGPEWIIGYHYDVTPKEEQDLNSKEIEAAKKSAEEYMSRTGQRPPMRIRDHEPAKDGIDISVNPNDTNKVLSIVRKKDYTVNGQPLLKVFKDALYSKYGKPTKDEGNSIVWSDKLLSPDHLFPCTQLGKNISNGGQLPYMLNYYEQNAQQTASCGIIMEINIKGGKSPEYVGGFEVTLANCPQANASLKALKATMVEGEQKGNQERLNKDAQKKPQL